MHKKGELMEAREELRKLRESTGMNRKEFCVLSMTALYMTEALKKFVVQTNISHSRQQNHASAISKVVLSGTRKAPAKV